MRKTKQSILIADCDEDLLDVLSSNCDRIGLDVFTACTGLGAVLSVKEHQPNVICIDADLPARDGLTVCELIAANDELSKIPMVVLTNSRSTNIRCNSLMAYCLRKRPDIWPSLRAVLEEISDVSADSAEVKN